MSKPFPLGGNGKGGKLDSNEQFKLYNINSFQGYLL